MRRSQLIGSRVPVIPGIARASSILIKGLACHLLVALLGPFTSKIMTVEERELTLKDASHAPGTPLTACQIQTAQPFSRKQGLLDPCNR